MRYAFNSKGGVMRVLLMAIALVCSCFATTKDLRGEPLHEGDYVTWAPAMKGSAYDPSPFLAECGMGPFKVLGVEVRQHRCGPHRGQPGQPMTPGSQCGSYFVAVQV